jgi:hypothetical protein
MLGYVTKEYVMALTNAERQARWRERNKAKLTEAAKVLRNDGAAGTVTAAIDRAWAALVDGQTAGEWMDPVHDRLKELEWQIRDILETPVADHVLDDRLREWADRAYHDVNDLRAAVGEAGGSDDELEWFMLDGDPCTPELRKVLLKLEAAAEAAEAEPEIPERVRRDAQREQLRDQLRACSPEEREAMAGLMRSKHAQDYVEMARKGVPLPARALPGVMKALEQVMAARVT